MLAFSCLSLDCSVAHALPQKELKEIDQDRTSGVTVQLVSDSVSRLTGFVRGAQFLSHGRQTMLCHQPPVTVSCSHS